MEDGEHKEEGRSPGLPSAATKLSFSSLLSRPFLILSLFPAIIHNFCHSSMRGRFWNVAPL